MANSDVCLAPVLSMAEAPQHAHNDARATFIEVDGIVQPAPAPRFSATPAPQPFAAAADPPAAATNALLRDLGIDGARIEALRCVGAIG